MCIMYNIWFVPQMQHPKFMQVPRQDETDMLGHMRNSQGPELMGQNALKSLGERSAIPVMAWSCYKMLQRV